MTVMQETVKMTTFAIYPYKSGGVWMFDDKRVGLEHEPLVRGTDKLIERATAQCRIKNPEYGFRLRFATHAFKGARYKLDWLKADGGGNTYHCIELGMDGWLCPALFKYFDKAPRRLYAAVEPMGA